MKPLTIGRLAKTADINVETIRYYQRIDLINQPDKPFTGYRVYPKETLSRIHFIKRAQSLGFSLNEIRQLLDMTDGQCETAAQMGQDKLHLIRDKITDLSKMAAVLEDYTQQCAVNADHSHCPLIDTLIDDLA
ncbi:MAG: Hg(II)-responsive transcriptional regulator [Cycloclasticus sp.]|nr:Hg(II)-responsive transcriptional regulator [Cycloclasticus sp.]